MEFSSLNQFLEVIKVYRTSLELKPPCTTKTESLTTVQSGRCLKASEKSWNNSSIWKEKFPHIFVCLKENTLPYFFGAVRKKKHYGLQPFLCRLNVQKSGNSELMLASGFSCFKDRDLAASLCQYCPRKNPMPAVTCSFSASPSPPIHLFVNRNKKTRSYTFTPQKQECIVSPTISNQGVSARWFVFKGGLVLGNKNGK